ncbi:MAG: 30S ribosomal protein S18 [Chlamydiia bacterium]|nr:30S ribosomal protein S18 [Chlamydiia bacterium]
MSRNAKLSVDVKFKRKRACPFIGAGIKPHEIDYKDTEMLQRFVTEQGKILPRRITNVSQRHQRALANAIKRARYMALLPFVAQG